MDEVLRRNAACSRIREELGALCALYVHTQVAMTSARTSATMVLQEPITQFSCSVSNFQYRLSEKQTCFKFSLWI